MSQINEIYNLLKSNKWVCGNTFLEAHIPEYRSRINELKKSGINVWSRRCLTHKHAGLMKEWRLAENVEEPKKIIACCSDKILFGKCWSNCTEKVLEATKLF